MKTAIEKIIKEIQEKRYPQEYERDVICHLQAAINKLELLKKQRSLLDLINVFCYVNDCEVDNFNKPNRKMEVVDARKMFVHYLRGEKDHVLARAINKDRTTVIHYRKGVKNLLATDPDFVKRYETAVVMLENNESK